jgi:transposase-like protein
MGKEYDFEVREQAEDLYVIGGQTFEQVARETGVSVTQLKTWGTADGWQERKKEYRSSIKNIRSNMMVLRKELLQKAVNSLSPLDVFATAKLELLAMKEDKKKDPSITETDKPAMFLGNLEFIAGILKDHDPEGLKILARNFDFLVDAFKRGNVET